MLRVALPLLLLPLLARARADERLDVRPLLAAPERLVQLLVARNAEVRAAFHRVAQSAAEVAQASVYPNPQLTLEAGTFALPDTNPPGLAWSDTTHYSIGIGETFELGKRGPRIHGAELRRDAAREDLYAAVNKKAADARLVLGRLAYLGTRQTALEENLAAARRVIDLEKARLDAGDISDAEWQRIVLDSHTIELDVLRNRAELTDALGDCRATFETACATDGLGVDALDSGAPLPEALPDPDQAMAARADVRALRLGRDSARDDATLARRRAIPDPTLSLTYTHDNLTIAGNQPNALSLDLAFPLPIFDTGTHDAAKAEARARELEEQAVAAALAGRSDLDGLTAKRAQLEGIIAKLRSDSIPRSTQVLEATRKAYDSGHVALSDLLLVERTHRELVILLLDTRFELFQTQTQLRQALGLDAELARRAS